MKKRYYLSMLSMFPLVILFDAVYLPAHKTLELFLVLALVHFVLYGLVNLLGIYFLYRPVGEAFDRGQSTPEARKRIQNLTWYSTGWIFLLGVVYFGCMLLLFFLSPMNTGDISLEKMPPVLWLTTIPSTLYIYAILPAFITWFLVNNFTLDLKATAFSQLNLTYPAGKKRIGVMLLVTFIILGFFPSLMITLELIASSTGDEYAKFSGMTPLEAILPDRIIVFIGMIFAVIYITRSFTKPIYSMLGEINKVREGDYSNQAAIITQDEIGELTKAFNEMVKGLRERELIRDTFGKYVTRDVANVILSQKINMAGETRQATILVTDIANYTSISESLSPEEVVLMLNEYLSVLVKIIQQHHGVVNKFMGDSVFAMFNVPLDDPNHAVNAIHAALEIEAFTQTFRFREDRQLTTRIGINTGKVVAGNIGSAERMEYTVIGDEVNVAARLEQLNKQHGTPILVGENTFEIAKAHFNFTELGDFHLKGKEKAIKVFKVGRL